MKTEVSPESSKDRTFLVCLIVFAAALVWFLKPEIIVCRGLRDRSAHALVSQLSQVANAYELDHACYPPRDGRGSNTLVRALQVRKSPTFVAYMSDSADMLDPDGNYINPAAAGKIIYYRSPGLHNPKSFDLWCEDSHGRSDGINNWQQ
jgi:hypothetical protein